MSAIRPRRLGVKWSLHVDQTGNSGAVDTFQVLVAPTITGVTNGGTSLNIAITDPNAGADTLDYTYHIQRSVDGSAFSTIFHYDSGALASTLFDNVMFVIGTTVTLGDGTQVTFSAAQATFVTMPVVPGFDPLTSATLAAILLDTEVLTMDGHSRVLPTGTVVTLPVGTTWTTIATPRGHTYSYKVSIQNKFQTTAVSNTSSVSVASTWTAQTLNVPTRVNRVVTLTWTDPNSYALGDTIEIWKDVGGAGYSLLATIVKSAPAMPTTYAETFDFLTLVPATYSYKLRSFSLVPRDTGPFSNVQSLVVNFSLSQITALAATPAFGDTQINLTWTDPNSPVNEAGIYVDRAVGATGQFQRIATVAPGSTSYSDVFVTVPGQTYAYQVTPFNDLHQGPVSTTALATTSLLTPTIVALDQLGDVGVRVTWSDLNQHADNYAIQRKINSGSFSTIGTVAGSLRQFDDTVALVIGDIVAYKVRASNAYVTGAYSPIVSMVIHRTLVAPTNVTPVFVRHGLVTVSWTGLNSGNRGVSLYKSIDGSAPTLLATLPKDARSYNDVFQTIPGQVYAYQVQDFNNQEVGPLSAFGVANSRFDSPISLQIAAVVPPDHVTLQWSSFTLPQATNEDYTSVERSFDGGAFSEIAQVQYGTYTFLAQTSGGVPGGVVSFRVRKVKLPHTVLGNVPVPANLGDYSQTVSTVAALSVPTSVMVTRSVAGVNHIAWSDANTLATGFKIFRQIVQTVGSIASPLVQVATVNDGAARSYDDTVEAAKGTAFTYSVLAFNAQTSSIYSGYQTLTTRFAAPRLELEQTDRTTITVSYIPGVVPGIAGDQLQLLKSLNGGPATVIYTLNQPFSSGFLFADTPVVVGDDIVYSARHVSASELGPVSTPVAITVGDVIDTPLVQIRQARIHGSRTKFIQRDIFVVGSGGVTKVSFNGFNDPVLASNTDPGSTNAYSGIAGDQTRFVVFTGTAPGSGQAVLFDAANVMPITTTTTDLVETYTYGGGVIFGQAEIKYYADMESAPYTDASTGNYSGWGLVDFTAISNMNPNFPLRLVPWTSTSSLINLASAYNAGGLGGQTTVPTPFSNASFLPRRLENLNGDCAFCINPTGDFTTIYRAQRNQNSYIKLVEIPGRVMDFVSDGVAKLVVLTLRGEIYLVDMQFNPTNPTFNIIGRTPGVPVNDNGDLVDPATDFMSVELMANRKIAVAVGTHNQNTRFDSSLQHESFIHVFDTPGILSTNGALSLNETIHSVEKVKSIAFDSGKYLYAVSKTHEYRLIRFNAGF